MSSIDKQSLSKDRLRKLVGENRLDDAVNAYEQLSNSIDSTTYRNIIIGVISQYGEFKQNSISGTLTADQKSQSTAKIRQALLNLADQIPEEYLPNLPDEKTQSNKDKWEQKVNRLFLSSSLGFFILCILLVVGSIGYYTYMYSHAMHAEHEHNLSFSGFVPFWASFGGLNASGVLFLVAKWLK
jgi:hypothetical protein